MEPEDADDGVNGFDSAVEVAELAMAARVYEDDIRARTRTQNHSYQTEACVYVRVYELGLDGWGLGG